MTSAECVTSASKQQKQQKEKRRQEAALSRKIEIDPAASPAASVLQGIYSRGARGITEDSSDPITEVSQLCPVAEASPLIHWPLLTTQQASFQHTHRFCSGTFPDVTYYRLYRKNVCSLKNEAFPCSTTKIL